MTILHLRPIAHEPSSFLALPEAAGIESRPVRTLSDDDLPHYRAILAPAHIDQRALAQRSAGLSRFLDAGGLLVFNGHITYPLLPELQPFVPAAQRNLHGLVVERVAEHPVFDGVDTQDLSFRRGVAGFYARGANPPPPGATVLHVLKADRSPIDWLWHRPAGGTILMHSGNNMWMYVDDPTSAARIARQVLNWVRETIAAPSTASVVS